MAIRDQNASSFLFYSLHLLEQVQDIQLPLQWQRYILVEIHSGMAGSLGLRSQGGERLEIFCQIPPLCKWRGWVTPPVAGETSMEIFTRQFE